MERKAHKNIQIQQTGSQLHLGSKLVQAQVWLSGRTQLCCHFVWVGGNIFLDCVCDSLLTVSVTLGSAVPDQKL